MDILSYILSKKYTQSSLVGMGALKGASATIQSITNNPNGTHDVVFEWEDNEGNTYTDTLVVKDGTDGTDGTDGVGIVSITKTGTSGLVDTYTVSLTNGDTETITVTNGRDGTDGTDGTNGTNGETPTISSETITGGNRVTFSTITPSQSVSIDVMDGESPDLGDADISEIGDGTVKGAIVTLEEQVQELSDTGAKNLLPNNNHTTTKSGITYTINTDGTITVNGTPTASSGMYQQITLPSGTYKLSGCPSGGSSSTYYVETNLDGVDRDTGEGVEFTLAEETTFQVSLARISSRANMTFTNMVFKPMITLADTPDSDYDHYVPYSKTNIELTKELAGKLDITSRYAYSRYTEWQVGTTTAILTMTSRRHRKTLLLMSNENVAFLYFYKDNNPVVTKVNGFNDLTVTLTNGTLENEGTATYSILGLGSYASNVIVDWSPNDGTNAYDDVVNISFE